MDLQLTSSAFEAGKVIPDRYTCGGEDISPPLEWRGVPSGTRSLVLICDDPDAPNAPFSHWVLYNIPPGTDRLPEDLPAAGRLSFGGLQGRNSRGEVGYAGPCPPRGSQHRYYFRLYALDRELDLTPGATRAQVIDRLHDHVLAQSELMGRFGRS